MAKREVRLGAKLILEDTMEADLIAVADGLNSSRRMSEFMTTLFRLACDNIKFYSHGNEQEYAKMIDMIADTGVGKERTEYFGKMESKVKEMQDKINSIYDIALKTYSLSQANKMNGLGGKSENIALAQFALQKQMRDIEEITGVKLGAYESGKLTDMKRKADDILEFIIESYDGIGEALGIGSNTADASKYEERIKELSKELETEQSENSRLRDKLSNAMESATAVNSDEVERLKRELRATRYEVEDLRDENRRLERKLKRIEEDDIDLDVKPQSTDADNTEDGINFAEHADIAALSNFFGE